MSAYVCDDRTIQLLAVFAALSEPSKRNTMLPRGPTCIDDVDPYATQCAHVLHAENMRSVNHRYGETDEYDAPSVTLRLAQELQGTAPVQVLKSAQCFAYQSCETDDWPTTKAHRLIEQARHLAISKLPGYDEADWS